MSDHSGKQGKKLKLQNRIYPKKKKKMNVHSVWRVEQIKSSIRNVQNMEGLGDYGQNDK